MNKVSEQINYSNHRINSYDQMSEMIIKLVSKNCENNYTSSWQLTCEVNSLLTSIVETPKNYLSNIDRKYDIRKVCTSSVNSSSTLFLSSVCTIYNSVNCAKNKI